MPGDVDPDLISKLMQHPYMQHLLREEIGRQNKEYWNPKRFTIVGIGSVFLTTVAFFGFNLRDALDLQKQLKEVENKLQAANELAVTLKRESTTAVGNAEKSAESAKKVEGSVSSIQSAAQRSIADSNALFQSSLQNGRSMIEAAMRHMKDNTDAGKEYAEAAKAALDPAIQTTRDLSSRVRELEGVAQTVEAASRQAQVASREASQARSDTLEYKDAVDRVGKLQKELAKAWLSETVNVLARDKDGTRMNSQPTVRLKHPDDPSTEYSFMFEMDSPGNSVSLRVTSTANGRSTQLCHQEKRSGDIHGKIFKLGESPFFLRPDFVYQSLLADDFVTLRVLAATPEGATVLPMGSCRPSWPK